MTTDLYGDIIYKSRYARWLPEKGRREHWDETVNRVVSFLRTKAGDAAMPWDDVSKAILNKDVMPSMRLMMTAGEACDRDNIAAYNCAYLAVNHKKKFAEALYILMNGTGVGFSVERQEVGKLPTIPENLKEVDDVIVVGDSKLGWAKAFKKLLYSLWDGDVPRVDYSRIRPAGSRLVTFGGRASGPEPLRELFQFVVDGFRNAAGRKLTSIEVHDIMCKIGEIVVVGGVRRSALISLSNLSDNRMRNAKVGEWWIENKQRSLANNSVAYTEKPDVETFMEEWLSLIKSKSGERGIFNRVAAQKQASKYGRRAADLSYGCNPCSEIILRDAQFCNLSEVVVRNEDTLESLLAKVRVAACIGTVQATLTDFQFLGEEWKKNCEEERLLGVSLTGVMDHPVLNSVSDTAKHWLKVLRNEARKVNEELAKALGINPATAITCVKPSGTVSQLVGCASGIHPRHSRHYIRNVRMDVKDPMCQFLIDNGVKHDVDHNYSSQMVFSFPQKAPEGALTRHDISAIQHLELWKMYQDEWCEHKPSITVNVKDEEWVEVGSWVWKHFDEISGIAFLPVFGHSYKQAPYEDCDEEKYSLTKAEMCTTIDWNKLKEEDDATKGSQEYACSGGYCEINNL